MSRLRRARRWWPAIPIVLTVLLIYAAWPGRSTYTVSPETTYITEPVDAQGYLDYPTALNARMAKGITPENNANVLIWRALGPHPEGGTMPPEYFKWLGIEQPPEEGEYLIGWDKYFQANLKTPPHDVLELFNEDRDGRKHWDDRVDIARKWPWKESDQAAIADWIRQNEKPLAVAIEASKRSQYFNPLVSKSQDRREARLIGSLLPSVQKCREIARALSCRAMSRVAEGEFDAAWQDLIACQRLGRLMMRSGTLIETLVGMAMVAISTDSQIAMLSHGNHPSTKLMAWLDDLQRLPPMPPLADKLNLGERFMTLDSLQSVAALGAKQLQQLDGRASSHGPSDVFWDKLFTSSIDWDTAFRKANRVFDRCAEISRMPDRAERRQAFDALLGEVQTSRDAAVELGPFEKATMGKGERGEMIGDILIALLLPAIEKVQNAVERVEQQQQNLQLAFALAAYRADTGSYPAKLDDLAPKYLPKIPGDIFSGKPLVYKPTEDGYLFYSVGVNGLDEDGRWTDDTPRGDDLRVRMPVPEPGAKKRDE